MGLAEVKADTKLVREQILKMSASSFDAKRELTENILPLLEGLVDALRGELDEVAEEVADQGEALDELIDQSGDVLHPETAAKIIGVIELGKLLCTELEQLLAKSGDDLTKKRVRGLVKSYRQGAEVVGEEIAEITIPIDDEETPPGEPTDPGEPAEEPEEGEPEDEEEDEGDEDDGQIAAKEQK